MKLAELLPCQPAPQTPHLYSHPPLHQPEIIVLHSADTTRAAAQYLLDKSYTNITVKNRGLDTLMTGVLDR